MKNVYEAGYAGKDSMRENAKKLLKGDTDTDLGDSYASYSSPQFEKRRPYKKGGHVPPSKSAKMSELHIPEPKKPKKVELGLRLTRKTGYPRFKKGGPVAVKEKNPPIVRAGKHPMIGEKEKSVELANSTKGKVISGVKAKRSLPYDASHGEYLKKGGKVKKRGY